MTDHAPLLTVQPHRAWYHGSPLRLDVVRAGSTVTPVLELARVFAHKPTFVSVEVWDGEGSGTVTLTHDGRRDGHLYRVMVDDPAVDLVQHPTSGFAPGEEVLTTRDLLLEYLEALPAGETVLTYVRPAME